MKLLSWNVNGLRAVMKKGFREQLLAIQPDIMGVQETKMQENQLTEEIRRISDYKSYFHSAERKGYSGVGIYTRINPLSVEKGLPGSVWNDNEGRVLKLEFNEFIFFNIYFPNGQKDENRLQYKLDFYDAVLDYFNTLRNSSGKGLVICGDYNTAHHPIDLARPKQNEKTSGFLPIERAWMDKLEEAGYIDTFRQFHPEEKDRYSWWSYRARARVNNVGWRIDYFYVNKEFSDRVSSAFILDDIMGSDHCPVGIELDAK